MPNRATPILFALLVLIGLGVPACELINPEEELPSFVAVEEAEVVLPTGEIVRGWRHMPSVQLLVAGLYEGTFEAPVVVPSEQAGENIELDLLPTIWTNGDPYTQSFYPFLRAETQFGTLAERDTTRLTARFNYLSDTLIEAIYSIDFESPQIPLAQVDAADSGAVALVRRTTNPFQGIGCGCATLTEEKPILNLRTSEPFLDRGDGTQLWAEVRYRGGIKFGFRVGSPLPGTDPTDPLLGFVPSGAIIPRANAEPNTWQTVYYDLRPIVNTIPAGQQLYLAFLSFLPSNVSQADICFDYIRLLRLAN